MMKDQFARGLALAIALFGLAMTASAARADGRLLGLFYNSDLERYIMGEIEPHNGHDGDDSGWIRVSHYGTGIAARSRSGEIEIDAADGVAYLIATPNDRPSGDRNIFTLDIETGNQIASHALVDLVEPTVIGSDFPYRTAYDPASKTLYGLVNGLGTSLDIYTPQPWYMVTIDPTTGEVDPIGSGFELWTPEPDSAFDAASGIFYFVASFDRTPKRKLMAVSVSTGALVSSPDLSSNVTSLELNPEFLAWDPVKAELLGLFRSTETDPYTHHLMSINTATGVLTVRGDTFQEGMARTASGALDATRGTWYVLLRPFGFGGRYRLYTLDVDAVSNTLIGNPRFPLGDFRHYPDYITFLPAPEPSAASLEFAALASLALMVRRRSTGRAR